jgi:hypothetical protein
MRVSLFDGYGALNSAPVFDAIRAGLDAIGIKHSNMDSSADVAVIWSMLWAGRMKSNQQVWQHFTHTGRPVIVAEVGMLKRGVTWKLGLNGTGQDAVYNNIVPGRAESLGIVAKPWNESGYNIVIACQRSDSEQWAGQPPTVAWLTETAQTIRQYSDRPIIIRPHPRERISEIPGCYIVSPKSIPGTYDSFDYDQCLKSAWAVINWNSGPGSQAIINGVPAFVGSSSLAAPVANLNLDQLENPIRPDRTQWLDHLARTEWTIEEISTGLPLAQLLKI